jgi:hypothetical protein
LLAFTRIESKGDFADAAYIDDGRETPLCRESPVWLPASEVRGEGLFLRLKESALKRGRTVRRSRRLSRSSSRHTRVGGGYASSTRLRLVSQVSGSFCCIRSRTHSCDRLPWNAATPRPAFENGFTVDQLPRNMVRWRAS